MHDIVKYADFPIAGSCALCCITTTKPAMILTDYYGHMLAYVTGTQP